MSSSSVRTSSSTVSTGAERAFSRLSGATMIGRLAMVFDRSGAAA